jgi:hypothetical protein
VIAEVALGGGAAAEQHGPTWMIVVSFVPIATGSPGLGGLLPSPDRSTNSNTTTPTGPAADLCMQDDPPTGCP